MGSSGGKRRGVGGGKGSGVVAPVVLLGSGAALWAALQQGPAQGAGGASGTAELGAAAAKVRALYGRGWPDRIDKSSPRPSARSEHDPDFLFYFLFFFF